MRAETFYLAHPFRLASLAVAVTGKKRFGLYSVCQFKPFVVVIIRWEEVKARHVKTLGFYSSWTNLRSLARGVQQHRMTSSPGALSSSQRHTLGNVITLCHGKLLLGITMAKKTHCLSPLLTPPYLWIQTSNLAASQGDGVRSSPWLCLEKASPCPPAFSF